MLNETKFQKYFSKDSKLCEKNIKNTKKFDKAWNKIIRFNPGGLITEHHTPENLDLKVLSSEN